MPRYRPNPTRSRIQLLTKPDWIKTTLPSGTTYQKIRRNLEELNLNTICEEANCPNLSECWGGGTATFMLLGDTCSRACRFCNVRTGRPTGFTDKLEPNRVATAVSRIGLKYVVLTSVDRDDLPDGGADHFAKTIRAIYKKDKNILVEVLIPDFQNNLESLKKVVVASPTVIAHNIETTRSLTPKVRDRRAGYVQSLMVLRTLKKLAPKIYTKSSIMLGLGESYQDLLTTLRDLRMVNVDILTIGQYLQPSRSHINVVEYVNPRIFDELKKVCDELGFLYTAAGPLVRSSYRAGELFVDGLVRSIKAMI